jgi:hypothetical protein
MPPALALTGVRLKIDRAQHHFNDLHARIRDQLHPKEDAKPIKPAIEVDQKKRHIIVRQPKSEPLDPSLQLIIGDCIHNLRSALDHLVVQLAIANGAGSAAASKTAFPVYLTSGEFNSFVRRKVAPFISTASLAEIEDFQPYKRTNMPETDILWLLSQLDIIDKHRLLVVVLRKFKPVSFEIKLPDGKAFSHPIDDSEWKPSEDGIEILRFDFSGTDAGVGLVTVNVTTATTVQFADTGLACDGWILEEVLDQAGACVKHIVSAFGSQFFGE